LQRRQPIVIVRRMPAFEMHYLPGSGDALPVDLVGRSRARTAPGRARC
jgi:hypothetical protein